MLSASPLQSSPVVPAFSRICLGGATFGREIDQVASFALMDHGVANGVTLFDTAANYSAGESERIIGAWLAARPSVKRPGIATKIYPPYTEAQVVSAVAASAARLGIETIDLLYLHKWDETADTPAVLRALDRLVREGRVSRLGASNYTAAQLKRALALQGRLGLKPFQVVQNNHNLAVRTVDDEMRQLCAAHGVAIITYSPLGAGYLTGKHRGGVEAGSRFAVIPGHQDVYFNPLAERRLARLQEVSVRNGLAMTHLALAWALHQRGVASVLIGGRTPAHLDQAFAASRYDDAGVFAELEAS
ncbi:aldo/keto reductase [Oleiharenicola lentus]|uniref:aldo/keto reductase n=1 Tax=Oleiharenicola lentus TaxID=2508720 RepID=UPI003F660E8F